MNEYFYFATYTPCFKGDELGVVTREYLENVDHYFMLRRKLKFKFLDIIPYICYK